MIWREIQLYHFAKINKLNQKKQTFIFLQMHRFFKIYFLIFSKYSFQNVQNSSIYFVQGKYFLNDRFYYWKKTCHILLHWNFLLFKHCHSGTAVARALIFNSNMKGAKRKSTKSNLCSFLDAAKFRCASAPTFARTPALFLFPSTRREAKAAILRRETFSMPDQFKSIHRWYVNWCCDAIFPPTTFIALVILHSLKLHFSVFLHYLKQ